MDLQNLLQYQIMSNIGNGGVSTGGVTSTKQMFMTLMQIILASSYKHIEKAIGIIFKYINSYVTKWIEHKNKRLINYYNDYYNKYIKKPIQANDSISNEIGIVNDIYSKTYKHETYKVSLTYCEHDDENDKSKLNRDFKILQAIFHHFTKLYNIPTVILTSNEYVPDLLNQKFEIDDNIICTIHELEINPKTNTLYKCKMELQSNTLTSADILSYLGQLENNYDIDKSKVLDNTIYIFDVKSQKQKMLDPRGMPRMTGIDDQNKLKEMQINTALPNLHFEKKPFKSNKYVHNVFGTNSKKVFNRLGFFMKNKHWYAQKGVPYHLGILLSGIPGSGKTSIIKAIANTLKRHIINIDLSKIKTSTQFKNMFTDEYIYTDLNDKIKIPIENRLYILEEIDLLGHIILDRQFKKDVDLLPDELSLADILTVLDGTNETPGRVVIMTSNYPEKLDKALLRGGRIDVSVKFNYCDTDEIIEYIEYFYDSQISTNNLLLLRNIDKWFLTYADLSQLCFSLSFNEIVDELLSVNSTRCPCHLQEFTTGTDGTNDTSIATDDYKDDYKVIYEKNKIITSDEDKIKFKKNVKMTTDTPFNSIKDSYDPENRKIVDFDNIIGYNDNSTEFESVNFTNNDNDNSFCKEIETKQRVK